MIKDALLKGECVSSVLKTVFYITVYVFLLFLTVRVRVPTFVLMGAWGSFALLGLFGPSYLKRKLFYVGDESGYSLEREARRAHAMREYMAVVVGVGAFFAFITSILAQSNPDFQPLIWLFVAWLVSTAIPLVYWTLRLNFVNKEKRKAVL